jgi:hypothetical protein
MLKVHLRVDRQNMAKVLRQLTVRPFVLIQLLYFLIEHNHEVFRNKGSMMELRQKMKEAVAKLYPTSDSEKLKPAELQESQLPDDLVDLINPSSSERKTKTVQLIREKNSTPGDGGAAASSCLWHNRPHAVAAGVSTGAISDPSSARVAAIMQHGKIEVQTGHKLISQWESKYISQVLPFVIPFMVSGPDYSFHDKTNRWRRRDDPRFQG